MSQSPLDEARRAIDEFDAYRNQPINYRGFPVRRGMALLLQADLDPDDLDELLAIDTANPVFGPPLADDDAEFAIMNQLVDENRNNASFDGPEYNLRS